MTLNSKTAIITGVSSGLGRAVAEALASEGVIVYGIARTVADLNELEDSLDEKFISVPLDITNRKGVDIWIDETFDDESPDILINNAGAGYFDKVDELPLEKWHQMIDANLSGVFYLTRKIVPMMKENSSGSYIFNIGSILGKISNPEMSAYSATKFGIRGFSEALFKELRYDNIKVTCFNPGSIETDFFAESGIEKHGNMLQPDELAETVVHILSTPDNMLISDLTVRPLNPKQDE